MQPVAIQLVYERFENFVTIAFSINPFRTPDEYFRGTVNYFRVSTFRSAVWKGSAIEKYWSSQFSTRNAKLQPFGNVMTALESSGNFL